MNSSKAKILVAGADGSIGSDLLMDLLCDASRNRFAEPDSLIDSI